jgi:arsenate reductase
MTDKPTVLFVCVHNAGRSQMAAGWLRHLAGDQVEVRSAGSEPADQINPAAVEAMHEVGIDITGHTPTRLEYETAQDSDVIITMGCGDACPIFPGKRYEDWELDDPAAKDVEAVRPIRDEIRHRMENLLADLLPDRRGADGKGEWGTPKFALGGGSGTRVIYPQPFYQRGKVSAADSQFFGGPPMRTVPDIAMDGDPSTGLLVGEAQVFGRSTHWEESAMAGTSLASPLLAGVIAVADQRRGHRVDFVNPLSYENLGTPALHDVTAPAEPVALVRADYQNDLDSSGGTLFRLESIDAQTTTIRDRPGYDTETGQGKHAWTLWSNNPRCPVEAQALDRTLAPVQPHPCAGMRGSRLSCSC